MRIVAISDMHGYLIDLPPGDLLIIAGDVLPVWNHDIYYQRSWLNNEFRYWLDNIPVDNTILTFGNHDLIAEQAFELIPSDLKCEILLDKATEYRGLKVYGTPWQLSFGQGWAFNLSEKELEKKWSLIPYNTDILVTHSPPYGYGDTVYTYKLPDEKEARAERAGSSSLAERIKKIKPKAVFFGHIHSGYGKYSIEDIKLYNCSIVNEQYKVTNAPHIITIDL